MTSPSLKNQGLVWGGLALVVAAIVVAYVRSPGRMVSLPVFGETPEFRLTNQTGRVTTKQSLLGNVWLCDVIFSRCPSQCLRMSQLMAEIEKSLPVSLPVKIVSLTADPAYDRPEVLRAYGSRFGADPSRWLFLTGEKPEINRLAVNGLKFVVAEKNAGERDSVDDLFIHTTKAALVDKQGRIRQWFSTEEADSLNTILRAVKALAAE